MKKIAVVLAATLMMAGCANDATIDGKKYETYGLLNKDEVADPAIKYHLVTGNVIWSVILCETIVAPVYFIGFSIYEPVGKK